MREPQIDDPQLLRIDARTDPALIEAAVAKLDDDGSVELTIDQPLPEEAMAATAAALAQRPEIRLIVDGRTWDLPGLSLEWLAQFPQVRNLRVHVYDALDLSPIGDLRELRKLAIEETKRRSLSLAFLAETPLIEELWLGGQGGRDFEAVAGLDRLRILTLHMPRTKTLDPLQAHPTLEGLEITHGGLRDLRPLPAIPNLHALDLWGIRLFDTDDLAPVGDCANLGGLSLGALGHVHNLAALARGPAKTLRFLMLDRMQGLETLGHLARCERLEEAFLADSRPADRRLDLLAGAPALAALHVGDPYSKAEIEAALNAFRGRYFYHRRKYLVGDHNAPHHVHWRMRAKEYLKVLDAS